MLHCLIDTVLTTELSRELVAIILGSHERSSEMSKVKVLLCVLPEILRKPIEMMPLRLRVNAMFIEIIKPFHEHLRHILIINRENKTGTGLVYFLSEVLFHQKIINILCISSESLVDPIDSVVTEVNCLVEYLCLSVGMEVFIIKVRDVKLGCIEHTFL